jgi:hypothetical protein
VRAAAVTLSGQGTIEEQLAEVEATSRARKAKYEQEAALLESIVQQDWVQKRLTKLRRTLGDHFFIRWDELAGKGQTNRDGIRIGPDGLQNDQMAMIVVRHELDHAKLYDMTRSLTIGAFEAAYVDRGETGPNQGTYLYELEELLVRLRDWSHLADDDGYRPDAQKRIRIAYAALAGASDHAEIESRYLDEIEAKLRMIAAEIGVSLD